MGGRFLPWPQRPQGSGGYGEPGKKKTPRGGGNKLWRAGPPTAGGKTKYSSKGVFSHRRQKKTECVYKSRPSHRGGLGGLVSAGDPPKSSLLLRAKRQRWVPGSGKKKNPRCFPIFSKRGGGRGLINKFRGGFGSKPGAGRGEEKNSWPLPKNIGPRGCFGGFSNVYWGGDQHFALGARRASKGRSRFFWGGPFWPAPGAKAFLFQRRPKKKKRGTGVFRGGGEGGIPPKFYPPGAARRCLGGAEWGGGGEGGERARAGGPQNGAIWGGGRGGGAAKGKKKSGRVEKQTPGLPNAQGGKPAPGLLRANRTKAGGGPAQKGKKKTKKT